MSLKGIFKLMYSYISGDVQSIFFFFFFARVLYLSTPNVWVLDFVRRVRYYILKNVVITFTVYGSSLSLLLMILVYEEVHDY